MGREKWRCLKGFPAKAEHGWLVYTDGFKLTDGGYCRGCEGHDRGRDGDPKRRRNWSSKARTRCLRC